MSSFKEVILRQEADRLLCSVHQEECQCLCYTHFEETYLSICLTDGDNVWRSRLDQSSVTSQMKLRKIKDEEAFFINLKQGFNQSQITVSSSRPKRILNICNDVLKFELYEVSNASKKTELQALIFRLANQITELSNNLFNCKEQLDKCQQSFNESPTSAPVIINPETRKNKVYMKRKKGMSMINPASRRIKPGQGVDFQE